MLNNKSDILATILSMSIYVLNFTESFDEIFNQRIITPNEMQNNSHFLSQNSWILKK